MKKGAVLLILLLALLFSAGLLHLFNLRFEAGDVYPPYSSLRADPLGARALHDSLAELVEVRRNFRPLERLDDGHNTVLLHLGTGTEDLRFTTNQYRAFEQFVRTGGRLVIALHPEYVAARTNRFATKAPTRNARPNAPPNVPPTAGTNQPPSPLPGRLRDSMEDARREPIRLRWDVDFGHAPLVRADGPASYRPATATKAGTLPPDAAALPDQLAVHTSVYFEPSAPNWRAIYVRKEGTNRFPVVLERSFGHGSIVLAADAYPFSNEALRQAREARLLTWCLGGRPQVIFDETHLGTAGDPGIAAMARRYRLHGLAAALVVLALLFIWRNAASFLPPAGRELEAEATHQVAGRDSAEGFINLLRRNIAPVDLLKTCLEQWQHTAAASPGRKPTAARLARMQQLVDEQNALDPRHRQPVQTYRRFCEILNERT